MKNNEMEEQMRETRERQETIEDIVAEMRYGAIPKHRTDHELLALYADCIEAAWKRERENAAEMREALEEITTELRSLSSSVAMSSFVNPCEAQPTVCGKTIGVYFSELSDRIEDAWKREIRTAAFRRTWIALKSSLREAKVDAKGSDAMPNTTLITLPCTAQELENALHSLCDHSGIWDATVDVRLRNVNALTISCNQTEGTNNGK